MDTLIGALNGNPNFTGGDDPTVGGMLKETDTTHWAAPNTGATNSSDFKALPAGCRFGDGKFIHLGTNGYFWSSTEGKNGQAYYQILLYNKEGIIRSLNSRALGFSVVCVRD